MVYIKLPGYKTRRNEKNPIAKKTLTESSGLAK